MPSKRERAAVSGHRASTIKHDRKIVAEYETRLASATSCDDDDLIARASFPKFALDDAKESLIDSVADACGCSARHVRRVLARHRQ